MFIGKNSCYPSTGDENDRRNTLCYITEKGEKIVDDLMDTKTKAEEELFKFLKLIVNILHFTKQYDKIILTLK